MDDITLQELKTLMAKGKNCSHLEKYKMYYKIASGKTYGNGCGSCACKYLFTWLSSYIKNT